MKSRPGGVLSRRGAALTAHEQRALDGDPRALRAIVRQALGANTLDLPFRDVELRAAADGTGGTRLTFTGYASVVEAPFQMQDWLGPYVEVMRGGCFARTIPAADVIFCLNHDWGSAPMARTRAGTMTLSEDSTGLLTEAQLDGSRADVRIVQSCIDAGELDAMSLAFWVTQQTWSPDYEQRDILEVDMDGGDTSVVTFPANPATTGTVGLRKRQAAGLLASRVPALLTERARTEKRAGKALSAATMDTLQAVLDLVADADVALDSAQPLLAELMGVPNPDSDDEAGETDSASSDQQQSAQVDDAELLRAARLARLRREAAA